MRKLYQITWFNSDGVGLGQLVRSTPEGMVEIIRLMNERAYKSIDPSKQYGYKEIIQKGDAKGTGR